MSSRLSTAEAAAGFDVGTSPHGLSANLHRVSQGACAAAVQANPLPSAKPVLTFSLTEAQRRALSFAAMCEVEELAAGYEAHIPEVQEAIRHLWEARRILEGEPA